MTGVRAYAPGRVNLIGDHTDYTGGFVLPMAIQLGVTVELEPGGDTVVLHSADEPRPAVVALSVDDPAALDPPWARYVAGVVALTRPAQGGTGRLTSTLPIGVGLSSSAALEVAVALALGCDREPADLAVLCREAEERAVGVPCGVMDQLISAAGQAGHALLIDCGSLQITPIELPPTCAFWIVSTGTSRELAGSQYAVRRRQCEAAEAVIGPLRQATPDQLGAIADPVVRRRARHVISENQRVLAAADALRTGVLVHAGQLMAASHASLRDDFEVSAPHVDSVVERLQATDGVHGARMSGAGFGGCVVALCDEGVELADGWRAVPSAGATVTRLSARGPGAGPG